MAGLVYTGATAATTAPLRSPPCKQHRVCHLQFGETQSFSVGDRLSSVGPGLVVCEPIFFGFLLGDEESRPIHFNKQTAV